MSSLELVPEEGVRAPNFPIALFLAEQTVPPCEPQIPLNMTGRSLQKPHVAIHDLSVLCSDSTDGVFNLSKFKRNA